MSQGSFPYAVVVDEFAANLKALWLRHVIVVVLCMAVGFGNSWIATTELLSLQRTWDAGVAKGRFVWRLSSPDGQVSALECDALNGVDGVVSAGGVLESHTITPLSSTAIRYSLVSVTAGYLKALWPTFSLRGGKAMPPNSAPVAVGHDAGLRLGLSPGATLAIQPSKPNPLPAELYVMSLLPVSPRSGASDRNFYQIRPAQGFLKECLIDTDPALRGSIEEIVASRFRGEVTIFPYLRDGQAADASLADRNFRLGWIWAGALVVTFALSSLHSRRRDFALYRLMGARTTTIWAYLWLELTTIACAVSAGSLIALVLLSPTELATDALLIVGLDLLRVDLLLLLLPLLGGLLLRSSRTMDILKGN